MGAWSDFERGAIAEMKAAGVRVDLRGGRLVRGDGGSCRGWCSGEEFVVARRCRDYKGVFTHEYCHFKQYVEKPEWWLEPDLFSVLGKRGLVVGDWDLVMASLACERDCEARVIRLARRLGLFDVGRYVRWANANLHYYHYVYLQGRWGGSRGSVMDRRILAAMPSRLVTLGELGRIDMGLMRVYDRVFG